MTFLAAARGSTAGPLLRQDVLSERRARRAKSALNACRKKRQSPSNSGTLWLTGCVARSQSSSLIIEPGLLYSALPDHARRLPMGESARLTAAWVASRTTPIADPRPPSRIPHPADCQLPCPSFEAGPRWSGADSALIVKRRYSSTVTNC